MTLYLGRGINTDQTARETTALYMYPRLVINANDVAHAATSPPAVSRHGGRHHIHLPVSHLGCHLGLVSGCLAPRDDALKCTRALGYDATNA
ncbi:hypothetical protein C480_09950 [Natrialba aegyptia DSM 13077]|uniref:Uncharacterized protein n=1 Tax=Natrialba aegyptia DSM 13077 TaxID=1227491 RepID=M0B893_9EURY|nr:hypothetical protein C480_09950 [Natrialba aegyptia DSM 13077]